MEFVAESPVYRAGWGEQRSLVKKLTEVMKQVKYIQKKGFNSFHKYRYATEADVNEKVREELAERSILMVPGVLNHSMREHTTKSGNTEYITCVQMNFTFLDGESGEQLVVAIRGEGQDTGDKGIYKAISGAQKYALMKIFMIPTGDDPEAQESGNGDEESPMPANRTKPDGRKEPYKEPPKITSEQVGLVKLEIQKLISMGGTEQGILDAARRHMQLNFNNITDLTVPQAETLHAILQEYVKRKSTPPTKGA